MNRESWKKSEPTKQQLDIIKKRIIDKKSRRKQYAYKLCFAIACISIALSMFDIFFNQLTYKKLKREEHISQSSQTKNDITEREDSIPTKYSTPRTEQFYLDNLKETTLSLKGKVLRKQDKYNNQVIEIEIVKIFYQKDHQNMSDIIEVKTPKNDKCELYIGHTYYMNLKDNELINPLDNQIEEIDNYGVIFNENWIDLKTSETQDIIIKQKKKYVRKDNHFDDDYMKFLSQYVAH